jgi:hypothetical protein
MQDGTAKVKMRLALGQGLTGQVFEKKNIMHSNKIENEP